MSLTFQEAATKYEVTMVDSVERYLLVACIIFVTFMHVWKHVGQALLQRISK
jgi:hypothetical protein